MGEMQDEVNEQCPKKMIYFNPPILKCDKFNPLTKVTDYQFNVTASNMPEWYTVWIRRLEQLYSSFTAGGKTDWEKEINMSVTSPVGHRFMNVTVNGISTEVLDVANIFNSNHDVKHHTLATTLEDYGFLREFLLHYRRFDYYKSSFVDSCSVVGNNVRGYDNFRANLDNYATAKNNKTCSVLLAADCSRRNSFAIFAEPVKGHSFKDKFAIRYFIGETSILVSPNDKENILVENLGVHKSKELVKMRNRNFETVGRDYLQYSK